MPKTINILAFIFMFAVSVRAQDHETEAVRAAFENYKSAILNDRGEEAVNYIDSRTVKYYSDILEQVKQADSLTLESLSLLDKMMVLSIRHRSTKEQIDSFDGKGVLVYAIREGMVGKNSVANNGIGDITVDGSFAKGQLNTNGQKAPFYFHFYKEDGAWKIDLTSLFPVSNMAFKKMVNESGQTENGFLLLLLEMISGKKPGKEIWEPFGK